MDSSCCVCLNNVRGLNRLSQRDVNDVTLLAKLKISVPQVEWNLTYQICEPCTNLLSIVHTFSETCVKSDIIRKRQLEGAIKHEEKAYCVKLDDNLHHFEPLVEPKEEAYYVKSEESIPLEAIIEPKEEAYYVNPEDNIQQLKVAEAYHVKPEDILNSFQIEPINNIKAKDEDESSIIQSLEYDNYTEGNEYNNDKPNYCNGDDKDFKISLQSEIIEEDLSPPKRFRCERCANSYASSIILIKHCMEVHDMERKNIRPFACTRCSSRFGNSSYLIQHVKYHEAVRSHVCTYCGKDYITKTDLNIHKKLHLNKREHKCETCTKRFNTRKDLGSHKLMVHTDPQLWKYFCEICDKRFPIKSNYDSHMRRHTGDKKFECHQCDKRFTDKCVLQRHMRSHSDVREFKCSECEKEYKDKRVLQVHMAKIHGIGIGVIKLPSKEFKYICHICPKAYYAKNNLTRHLYTHSGEKPFFCTLCDRRFIDKPYIKQHMKKVHNVNTDADK